MNVCVRRERGRSPQQQLYPRRHADTTNSTHLGHGFSHAAVELVLDLGNVLALKEEKGRLGLSHLRRHGCDLFECSIYLNAMATTTTTI